MGQSLVLGLSFAWSNISVTEDELWHLLGVNLATLHCTAATGFLLSWGYPNHRAEFQDGPRVLYEVTFAFTDPVLRLCQRTLRRLVALLAVCPICGLQLSFLLMVIDSYLDIYVILKWSLGWYWYLVGLLAPQVWMISPVSGWIFMPHLASHKVRMLRSSWRILLSSSVEIIW